MEIPAGNPSPPHKISIYVCNTIFAAIEWEVMSMFKRLKQKINRFLDRLAKANQDTFGTQPLECCKLEKRENSGSLKR